MRAGTKWIAIVLFATVACAAHAGSCYRLNSVKGQIGNLDEDGTLTYVLSDRGDSVDYLILKSKHHEIVTDLKCSTDNDCGVDDGKPLKIVFERDHLKLTSPGQIVVRPTEKGELVFSENPADGNNHVVSDLKIFYGRECNRLLEDGFIEVIPGEKRPTGKPAPPQVPTGFQR